MIQNLRFSTQISGQTSRGLVLRGRPVAELIDEADFVGTLFFSITGRESNIEERKLINSILISSLDQGIQLTSGFIPRVVAATGSEVNVAMASTLLSLGPANGGNVSAAMEIFLRLKKAKDIEKAGQKIIEEFQAKDKEIPGFGHSKYKDRKQGDPQAKQLFQLAIESGFNKDIITTAQTLEEIIEWKMKKVLVINVEGAIAALLVTMGFDSKVGSALVALARVAGSIAHIIEEQHAGGGVRYLPEEDVEYVG